MILDNVVNSLTFILFIYTGHTFRFLMEIKPSLLWILVLALEIFSGVKNTVIKYLSDLKLEDMAT